MSINIRRVVAGTLLLITAAYSYESVYGAVHDGAVHHESEASAAIHQTHGPNGEHGHEDGAPPAQHHHGPHHQHGTASDHCTHIHGLGVTSSFELSFVCTFTTQHETSPILRTAISFTDEFRPPKA